jgi:hypothetical protein
LFITGSSTNELTADKPQALKSVVYYLHVLRGPLKRLLLMIGITVSWATLVRPVRLF